MVYLVTKIPIWVSLEGLYGFLEYFMAVWIFSDDLV
jgi:hypothetical protein